MFVVPKSIQNINGKEIRTRIHRSRSNPYLVKLSGRGEILNIMPIETPRSVYSDRIVKVNDGSINLLGYESTFSEASNSDVAKTNVMHMMTTYDLKKDLR